ncbi:small integral membrane protein 20-like [Haliotis rufescens]|uniref:small integral membrane protein 20-like n=1 Tax=Haliotis rufescens TaxID=6454 RepID=UPI001EB02058|nr:small integral membrane protein 20-like [Haliotis rufescens]
MSSRPLPSGLQVSVKMTLKYRVRNVLVLGALVGGICVTLYPIMVQPFMHPEEWQKIQKTARAGIDRESIQPGGMKVWSNPFDKKN